jgi:hypothetical protein
VRACDRSALRDRHVNRVRNGAAVATGTIILIATAWAVPADSANLKSCGDIREYFKRPLPEPPYARVRDLESVVELVRAEALSISGSQCEDWLIERSFFEYAIALDKYSESFPEGSPAMQRWARDAAAAYGSYIEWVLGLDTTRRTQLIRLLVANQAMTESEFRAERGKWLRGRVGNVLNGLGTTLIRANRHNEMFGAYDRSFRESIEIFPNEIARKWYRWLRRKPDFARDRVDAEIKRLIKNDDESSSQWTAFGEFLESFVAANRSVEGEWIGVRNRIVQWLAP